MKLYSRIMRKNNQIHLITILAFIFISCEDILEEDIQDEQVISLNPKDGDTIQGNTIQFNWGELKGADEYRIQIFENDNLSIIRDTIVQTINHSEVLSPGSYRWRIRGQNSAYTSIYSLPESFTLVTSDDLTNQTVLLTSPSDQIYLNNNEVLFNWQHLDNSDFYNFELQSITTSGNITIHLENQMLDNVLTLDDEVISQDAHYRWKVKALNAQSETIFFSRDFFIDTQNPQIPVTNIPEYEDQFDIMEEVQFQWSYPSEYNQIAPVLTLFEIANDQNFQNIIFSDQISTNNTNYEFEESGSFYWRIRGEDLAGNIGSFTQNGKIIINE